MDEAGSSLLAHPSYCAGATVPQGTSHATPLPHSVQVDPTRRRVVILANPRAGAGSSLVHVEELAAGLHERGLEPLVCWQREEFTVALAEGDPADLRCVVAAGGDGTLVETLNRAPGCPVALLPVGTENLVARFWRMERSGQKLAELIAVGGCRRLDLARLYNAECGVRSAESNSPLCTPHSTLGQGRLFCLMAGAGFDAEVVQRVHGRRHGHINQFTYAWPILQSLRRYRYPPMEVETDTGERLRGTLVFVFNLPRYAAGIPVAPDARGDDGLLDLCVFERAGIVNLFRYLYNILRGRREKMRDLHRRLVRRVRLTAADTVRVQTDGDPAGCLPATIEVEPGALTLLVPSEACKRKEEG
jgi:diacylglycerol kinase (ATP)